MRFEFTTAGRIIFGAGTAREIGPALRGWGKRALLVCGAGSTSPDQIAKILIESGLEVELFRIPREPSLELVRQGVERARAEAVELVIGYGGGSSIDAAKAIGVLSRNPGDVLDYLEVIGKGAALSEEGLPVVAIPTTAGTGSEVTRNAVVYAAEQKMKVSLRGPQMLPRLAVVDPELTYTLPPAVTAATGMDALTQVLEPFVSIRAQALSDGICREGMTRAGRSLLTAYQNGNNPAAREDMSFASLAGGLALANAGLGAVHGFASPLGGSYDAPHGVICARLLAPVTAANLKALDARGEGNPARAKYDQAARLIMGHEKASGADLPAWLDALSAEMQIPRLSDIGVRAGDFDEIISKALSASSMKANPLPLNPEELREILAAAF